MKYFIALRLRRLEDPLHILDRAVLGDARPHAGPIDALFAQHIVLRVDEDDGGVAVLKGHALRLGRAGGDRKAGSGNDSGSAKQQFPARGVSRQWSVI